MTPNSQDRQTQMTLEFDPGLVERYGSLVECVAAGVYRRGLKRTAADVNQAPGNLSVQLSEEGSRHLSVETLELYLQRTGDRTPIHYLVERYCGDQSAARDEAIDQVRELLARLPGLLEGAGMSTTNRGGNRK